MLRSSFMRVALFSGFASSALFAQGQQSLTFDPAAPLRTPFIGLGVEFDPYLQPVAPTRWQLILNHLAFMRPGFFRVMSGADDYCTGFDSEGKPQYRWQTEPDAPQLRRVFDVLDFAQQQGIEVYLGEWSPPAGLGIKSPADPRWSRIVADFVDYLIHKRHYTVLNHYILMNEPNGQWMWHESRPNFDAWATGVRSLRKELDARGLQSVLLTGPDNSGSPEWFRRSVAELHTTFGAWEQHIYAKDDQISSGAMETQLLQDGQTLAALDPSSGDKIRFIAESGLETGKIEDLDQQPRVHDFDYGARMADYVIQVARAGWAGADAWDLDDAMHGNGRGGQKIWGFFDSSSDAGLQPRPWYYAWTVLSRAMPRGATVVKLVGDTAAPVRGTAATWSSEGKSRWSVMLVNHTDQPAHISLKLPAGNFPVYVYHYFEGDRPVSTSQEPRPAAVWPEVRTLADLSFPSRGMIVLTTQPLPMPAVQPDAPR